MTSPLAALAVVASFIVPCAGVAVAATVLAGGQSAVAGAATTTPYPLGTPNSSEPSGMAPPSASALSGYGQTYVQDFAGTSVPSDWDVFTGKPGGNGNGQWAASQVQVSNGMLQETAALSGSQWITGGACQCSDPQTYGAYFVRSRMTGPGPTQVELLFPTNGWPPEVDFAETGGDTSRQWSTAIWGLNADGSPAQVVNTTYNDLTQWHTWGVIWTPTSLIYTLDGQEWASVTVPSEIPQQPMTLDIQQQTWCGASPAWACPTASQTASLQVDWVAEYTAGASSPTTTTTQAPPTTTTAPPVTTTTKPPTTTTTKPPTTTTTKPPTTTTTQAPATTTTVKSGTPTTTTTKPPTTTTTTKPPTTTTTPPTTTTTSPSDVAQSVAVSPFAVNSAALSSSLRSQVVTLARTIKVHHNHNVLLVGMAGRVTSKKRLAVSRERADAVAQYLRAQLRDIHAKGVTISAFAQYNFNGATLGKVLTSKLKTPSVVALIH